MSNNWANTELLDPETAFGETQPGADKGSSKGQRKGSSNGPAQGKPPNRLGSAEPVIKTERTPVQVAIAIAVVVHILVLMVPLSQPGSLPRKWLEERLEVILVNAQGPRAADKPLALAQANLAGGGDGAPDERATSPLPPMPSMELGEAPDLQQRQQQALAQQQQELLANIRNELARMPEPNPETESATAQGRDQAEHRRLLLEQLAQIERRVNENSAGPRQRFVSPATQEVAYAMYYDQVRQRIEARGTRDFPSQAGRKLYGKLTMTISIDVKGQVLGTEIVETSGIDLLDRRAAAIVQASGPYGPFTEAMRKEAEVLILSARFTFDRDLGVQAQLRELKP